MITTFPTFNVHSNLMRYIYSIHPTLHGFLLLKMRNPKFRYTESLVQGPRTGMAEEGLEVSWEKVCYFLKV